MRKTFLLLTCLFSAIISMAQFNPVPVKQGTSTQILQAQGAYQGKLGFILPVNDTTGNPATSFYGAVTVLPSDTTNLFPPIYMTNGHFWFDIGKGININDTVYVDAPLYAYFDSTGHQHIAIQQQDGLVGACPVVWDSLLVFSVPPCNYVINGTFYTSPATTITLDAADPTNPRYDLFIVDTVPEATKITGTPAAIPTIPQVDPQSQIALTSGFLINPGDTVPNNATQKLIYDENTGTPTEWAFTTSGTLTANANNTDNPKHKTKAIFVSSYTNNSKLNFLSASTDTFNTNNGQVLWGYVYFNGAFLNKLKFQFFNGSTAVSSALTINNTFGLNPNDSNRYQLFSIPLSAFTWTNTVFDKLVITHVGTDNSGAKGYYIDWINIQSGVMPIPSPIDYSNKADSAGTYKINDSTYITRTWVKGSSFPVGDTIHASSTGGGGGGSGTVTSISQGYGITNTPNPITTTGTVKSDTTAHATSTNTGYLSNIDWQAFHGKVDSVTKNTSQDSFYVWTNGSHTALKDSSGGGGLTNNEVELYKTTDRSYTTAFTYTTDPTVTVSDTSIYFNSSTPKSINFYWNNPDSTTPFIHNYERWDYSMVVQFDSLNANDSGFNIGTMSTDIAGSYFNGFEIKAHPASSSLLYAYFVGQGGYLNNTGNLSFKNGDNILIDVQRNRNTYTLNLINQRTTASLTLTGTIDPSLSFNYTLPLFTQKFALQLKEGHFEIKQMRIVTYDGGADFAFIGNSITAGTQTSNYYKSFVGLFRQQNLNTVMEAGGGCTTYDVIAELPAIIKIRPKRAVIMIGTNDITSAYPISTTVANIKTIESTLSNAGINYTILGLTPRASNDVRPYNDSFQLSVSGSRNQYIAPPYQLFKVGSYQDSTAFFNADNIHPNDSGHVYIAAKILSNIFDVPNEFKRTIIPQYVNIDGKTVIGNSYPITPTDSLFTIYGGLRYVNGSQGANKFLQSDANGGITAHTLVAGDIPPLPYLSSSDTVNKWVSNIYRKVGVDSIFFQIGSTQYAILDSAGGGSTIKQTYTSGATVTANNTTTWLIINPASIQSTLTITLAATPTDGQKIEISFGGTITSGNGVVTTLTLSANSGQTLVQSSTPSFMQSGDAISYRYNATNTSWYRIN